MVSINNVVGFNVVIQDASPSQPNFGTIAVIAHHDVSPERLVYDTSPDGRAAMIVDGFAASHDAYRKNLSVGAQSPKVKSIKVYNRASPNVQALTLTPINTEEGRKYSFSLNGIAISHTNGSSETVAGIVTALQALLDDVDNVDATDNTTDIGLALTSSSGERMYLKGAPGYLTVKDSSPDAGIAADLTAALIEDSDFYGVLIDGMSEAELIAAAAWCQSNGKMLHGQSVDSDILTSSETDIASDMKAAGYHYAKVWYSRDMAAGLAAAIMGRQFSRNPGSTTWENQRLAGIVADPLTPTELANAEGKGCGLYLPYGNVSATYNTAAASGRFLDVTRDSDWLTATAQADVFGYLLNQEKVPFTQAGIDGTETVLRARFTIAEQNLVLDAGWDIVMPSIADIDTASKATRQLTAGNAFSGVFQGAIHGVDISGVLAI